MFPPWVSHMVNLLNHKLNLLRVRLIELSNSDRRELETQTEIWLSPKPRGNTFKTLDANWRPLLLIRMYIKSQGDII